MPLINKYDAAVRLQMSPELLDWFARYAAKHGDFRKLVCAKDEFEVSAYDENDLREWDAYLWAPWPKTQRNPPDGIVREIMLEARGQCSFCSDAVVGEYGHINAWGSSFCHHPHNLLYLCPTCHTRVDRTKEIKVDVLKQRKKELLDRRSQDWRIAAKNHADLRREQPPKSYDDAIRTLFKINYDNAVAYKPSIQPQFVQVTGFANVDSIPPNDLTRSIKVFGEIYADYFPTASGSFTAANSSFQESKNWQIRCGTCGELYSSGFNVPRASLFGNNVQCPKCKNFNDASYFNVLDPQKK